MWFLKNWTFQSSYSLLIFERIFLWYLLSNQKLPKLKMIITTDFKIFNDLGSWKLQSTPKFSLLLCGAPSCSEGAFIKWKDLRPLPFKWKTFPTWRWGRPGPACTRWPSLRCQIREALGSRPSTILTIRVYSTLPTKNHRTVATVI